MSRLSPHRSFSTCMADRSAAVVYHRASAEGVEGSLGRFNCVVCAVGCGSASSCGHATCWTCVKTLRLRNCPVCRAGLAHLHQDEPICSTVEEVGRRLRRLAMERDLPVMPLEEYRRSRSEVVQQLPHALESFTSLQHAVQAVQDLEELLHEGLLRQSELGLGCVAAWLRERVSVTPLDALPAAVQALERFPKPVQEAVQPGIFSRLEDLLEDPQHEAAAWSPVLSVVAPSLGTAARRAIVALALDAGLREVEACKCASALAAWVEQSRAFFELVRESGVECAVACVHRQLLFCLQRPDSKPVAVSGAAVKWQLGREQLLKPWHERAQALALSESFSAWTRELALQLLQKAREDRGSGTPARGNESRDRFGETPIRGEPRSSRVNFQPPSPASPAGRAGEKRATVASPASPMGLGTRRSMVASPLSPTGRSERRATVASPTARRSVSPSFAMPDAPAPAPALRPPAHLRDKSPEPGVARGSPPQSSPASSRRSPRRRAWVGVGVNMSPQRGPRTPTSREQCVGRARARYSMRERQVCQQRLQRPRRGPREDAWAGAASVVSAELDRLEQVASRALETADVKLWRESLRQRAPLASPCRYPQSLSPGRSPRRAQHRTTRTPRKPERGSPQPTPSATTALSTAPYPPLMPGDESPTRRGLESPVRANRVVGPGRAGSPPRVRHRQGS